MSAKSFNPMRRQFYSLKLAHTFFVSLPNWMAAGVRSLRNETVKWAFLLGGASFLFSTLFVFLVAQPTINVVDGPTYHRIGYHLAQEFQYNGRAYPYPLYPIFLAVIYALGGAYFAVYLVQGLLLALTVGLSYWLARHLAGHGAGVFAALLVTLDATLLGNVGLIATENLQTPLLMLAVMLSLHALGQERARYHIGAGVLWGILTLVKPATLLWPPLLLPVYIVIRGRLGWRPWLFLVLAYMLTISPWLLRNQLASEATETGQFYNLDKQGYSTLLMHIADEGEVKYDANQLGPKLQAMVEEARAQSIEPGSTEFELYTLRLLWQRIGHSPRAYFGHLWSNFSYFWTEPPIVWVVSVYNHRFMHGYRQTPGYGEHARLHMALALMGLLSILLLYRRRPRAALCITAFLLYYAFFYTMYIVEPRFSVPVMPLTLVCAAMCPTLAVNALKENLGGIRVLGNACLAAVAVGLVTGVVVHQILQRPNYIQGGSFETAQAEEEWTFVEQLGEPRAPLVADPHQARDGFRAAVLHIGPNERGAETRFFQEAIVWFDTNYRLKFSYLVTEGKPRLYVLVLEWDAFKEGWKEVGKEFLPVVSNVWSEYEYEFEVSGSARMVTVFFGLYIEPGTVLIDNVSLELAEPIGEIARRPYLLTDPMTVNRFNYLPLEMWVNTQPEENRTFLLNNPGVSQEHGWRGGDAGLESVPYILGGVVMVVWAFVAMLFIRLQVIKRIVNRGLLDLAKMGVIVVIVAAQAATCYLLLFSRPQ